MGLGKEEGIGDDLAVQEPVLLGEGPDDRVLLDVDGPVVHREASYPKTLSPNAKGTDHSVPFAIL